MGLIDGEQAERLLGQALEQVPLEQAFRRHVKQLQPLRLQLLPDLLALPGLQAGVQARCRHSQLAQRLHLVLDQGDQRRNHQGEPRPAQGRHLIAE